MADKEYIEREAVLDEINELIGHIGFTSPYQDEICLVVDGMERARDKVEYAPATDVVEAVRCEKCKHFNTEDWDGEILCGCNNPSGLKDVEPNAYCSCGERK